MERLKVLVVEDDRITQRLYGQFLPEDIFELHLAKTGGEALEIYHTWQPEVIILDLMLPEITGYSVLKEIRENLEDKTIPIIISSILSNRDDVLACAKFGIQGYFFKPTIWKEIGLRVLECARRTYPQMAARFAELKKELEAKREFKERSKIKGEPPEQVEAKVEPKEQPKAKAEPE